METLTATSASGSLYEEEAAAISSLSFSLGKENEVSASNLPSQTLLSDRALIDLARGAMSKSKNSR